MYNVQILSDQEFESLPYPETETSLGIADPVTNTAYVRYTHSDELNKYLVNHELEHLIDGQGGEHSTHYRNGVYYKGFGDVIRAVISPIFGFLTGGPIGGAMGAVSSVANRPRQQFAQQGEGYSGFGGGQSQASFRPTQSGTGVPSAIGGGFGASGGSGALGEGIVGSPVDKLRNNFGVSDEEALKRQKGYGLGGY